MRKKLYILLAAVAFIGCANRGVGPQGGPKDTVPPVPLRYTPENGTVNFANNKIEVVFNEYLQLDNLTQNLLMSPPQQRPPDVKARGKHLIVNFTDSLQANTTYTLDFGNAVCDFTEKNPCRNFIFAFSTGPQIDTLEFSGHVYDAENLNPVKGIIVGVHSNQADSAFTKMPFARIARTDTAGSFRIGNMKEGRYRLYAVEDISHDYRLTPGEALAFADSLIESSNDTTDGHLWLFRPQQQRLYLQRTAREKQHIIRIIFSTSPDSLPVLRALSPSETDTARSDSAWIDPMPYIHTQYSARRDTVTLWLTDSIAIGQDSIFLEARYRRTDSLYNQEWYTDTLRAIWRAPRLSLKAQQAQERKNRNRRLDIRSNARTGFEIYDTLRLTCTTPIVSVIRDSIHLYEKVDTILRPVSFAIEPFDSLTMQVAFSAALKAGKQYELHLDSGALHDIYGITHLPQKYSLQVKTPEDYSTLRVRVLPYVPNARVQVLNARDEVVREAKAEADGAFFRYLKPDTYYLRMYVDKNGDGLWTTGSWDDHRQPEPVYYFPGKLQTKSNWDFEEEWNYLAIPRTQAKPYELIKASSGKKK